MKPITLILWFAFAFFFNSCKGQVNNNTPKSSIAEPSKMPIGQPKMLKTQGSTEFDNIHCSLRDKVGNLWFGATSEGVYRYDGQSFVQFTTKDGLKSNTVWCMLEDKAGNIWFGTDDGISKYDGQKISHVPIDLANNLSLSMNTPLYDDPNAKKEVHSILQDKKGTIWFGTTSGIYCYNGQSFTRFLDNAMITNSGRLTLRSVQCMWQDRKGNIWFGSGPQAAEGVIRYDGNALTNYKPKNETWIRNIFEAKNSDLWLATRHHGACRYDGKTFSYETVKANVGSPLLEDSAGNIWFGGGGKENDLKGDGGIWRFDGQTYTNYTTKDGLTNYSVWSIVEDKNGGIWVGTRNNNLYHFDGKKFMLFSE
jgi:ligand-binding sensor domain-containing protein